MTKTLIAIPKEQWSYDSTTLPKGYYNKLKFIDKIHEMDAREPLTTLRAGDYALLPTVHDSECEWRVVKIFQIWENGDIQHTNATFLPVPAKYFYRPTEADIAAKLDADAKMKQAVAEMLSAGERLGRFLAKGQHAADRDI